ncbi:capsular polysaccharide biosynthesis protein [Cyanobium sp. Morenito 9A2]|nr:capsular polysaccharide biosynthesis protein [Cyanobium sp. Morenito 9A2]
MIEDVPPEASLLIGAPCRGIASIVTLDALLMPHRIVRGRSTCAKADVRALLAWGRKSSGRVAAALGVRRQLPVWLCEDGFLRSIELGSDGPPLSLLVDDLGIYYDASVPSRLEQLICQPLDIDGRCRAAQLQQLWCENRVSKYNGFSESPVPSEPFVLVVDQTAGDLSISHGLSTQQSFHEMLSAALFQYPHALVVVKVHPDVAAGRKRGHFSPAQLTDPRILVVHDGGHPTALLERAEAVFVVTSQLGFEALLWGQTVHCFGMPFYAGWGLTQDLLPAPLRRAGHRPTLERLIHACLVDYARYIDPHHHQRCSPERLIRSIGLQRRLRGELPSRIEVFGFKPWKQPILRCFLAGSRLRFRRRHSSPTVTATTLAIWGREPGRGVARRVAESIPPALLHVEDGFVRSVGLGANLIEPLSWIIDRKGLYYDANHPSDLELLLENSHFSASDHLRSVRLCKQLVAASITKYNLPADPWQRPFEATRVVLVPGQVETDASIRYGAPLFTSNLAFLKAVRDSEPNAWIVYKPHPDVVARLRQNADDSAAFMVYCDEILTNASIAQLYDQVDALHVLTSLSGFEALLRGKEVHTWGMPFYAGWGLTHDRVCITRRKRTLSLEELVFNCLIVYPRYVSRHSGLFIEVEEAIAELIAWRSSPPQRLGMRRGVFRHWRRVMDWLRACRWD